LRNILTIKLIDPDTRLCHRCGSGRKRRRKKEIKKTNLQQNTGSHQTAAAALIPKRAFSIVVVSWF